MKRIKDIFIISNGNGLALSDMKEDNKGYNFISRGEKNNGIVATIKKVEGIEPFGANKITVSLGGSVLESFYQDKPFYTAYHIKVLTPRINLTALQMFYYCNAIKHNKYRYSYGRQANKTLDDLLIPDINEIPEWVNDIKFPSEPNEKPFHNKKADFKDRNWGFIKLDEIFSKIEKCKCSNASELLTDGDDIYYIGAKKVENGIMNKVSYVKNLVSKGNCIVFIGDGQGSVGYVTYQEQDFIGSSTLNCGYSEYLNKFIGLFLVTVLDLERYRYSFGRKYGKEQVKNTKIKLPLNKRGEPDWEFMENYIKSLPYSASI
jgi:hypothetical protein